jgi:Cu/Ag efflux protein CusF
MKSTLTTALIALLCATGNALAAGDHAGGQAKEMQATDSAASMTEGEVRKVDTDAKKITLKHGEIKNLGMPGMTMVFQVKEPSMLEKVKVGDKVRFTADKVNGAITVTAIEATK